MSQAVNTWNVHNFDVNTNTQVQLTVSWHAEYKQQLPSLLSGKLVFNDNTGFSASMYSSCEGAEGRMLVCI
jgi:hypothetical protein